MKSNNTKDFNNFYLFFNNKQPSSINLFSFFAMNQRVEDQPEKKRNDVKDLMKICEKYATVLSSQESLDEEIRNQTSNPNSVADLKQIYSALTENNFSKLKSLSFIKQDSQKASALVQSINAIGDDSFAKYASDFLKLDDKPKKIELLPNLELDTSVPVIKEFGFVDVKNIDESKYYMGKIDNSLQTYPVAQTEIPVASFKIQETFNKEQNRNVPVNIKFNLERQTLADIIIAGVIQNALETPALSERVAAVAESVYNKEISKVTVAQLSLLSLLKKEENEKKRLDSINQDLDQINAKIKALSSSGRETEKYQEKLDSLLPKQKKAQKVVDELALSVKKMQDLVETKTAEVKIDPEEFSKKFLSACKMSFEREIQAEVKAWCENYGSDVKTILNRKVYVSPVDNKHYILPIDFAADEKQSSVNYSLCPTVEDDLKIKPISLNIFNIDENNSNAVMRQNEMFIDFMAACPDVEFILDKKAKDFAYFDKTNKMIIPAAIVENGKSRGVQGIECAVKSLEKIIEAKFPKKLIGVESERVREISKLRALEFMCRALPGLGSESAIEVSKELHQIILKNSILIPDQNIKEESVSHSANVAGQLLKSTLVELGMEPTDAIKLHAQNGFYYAPIKPYAHRVEDWFSCPAKQDSKFEGEVEISKADCLKIQRLNNIVKTENFIKEFNKTLEKVSKEDIEFQFKKDGCVALAKDLNNQLNLINQFTNKKRQPATSLKVLTKATSQVLAILMRDTTKSVLRLIDRNEKKDVVESFAIKQISSTQESLVRAIAERASQTKIKDPFKKEKDVVVEIDGMLCVKKAVEEKDDAKFEQSIDNNIKIMANKLDYFLSASDVGVELVNLAKGCGSFSEDISSADSQFIKTLKNISRQEKDLSSLPQVIMRFISFKKGAGRLLNSKDTVRNIVNGVCSTGFPDCYFEIDEAVNGNADKIIKELSTKTKVESDSLNHNIFMDYSVKYLSDEICAANSQEAILKLVADKLYVLDEIKSLYENKEPNIVEQLDNKMDKYYSISYNSYNEFKKAKKNFKID